MAATRFSIPRVKAGARSYWALAASLAIFVILVLTALGIKRVRADEISGLSYIGPVPAVNPVPFPPGMSDAEENALRVAGALAYFDEQPSEKIAQSHDTEVYRFLYEPFFDSRVCVTVWQEGDLYRMRTVVVHRQTDTLWGKTETISARKWNRLRTAFTKHSVTDPLDGANPYGGTDGSSWLMESRVSGRVTITRITNPVRSFGPSHFQIVKSRDSRLDDFVKTSFLFLDWAGVRVPEMY